jgi:hypothetical protein
MSLLAPLENCRECLACDITAVGGQTCRVTSVPDLSAEPHGVLGSHWSHARLLFVKPN